jgi:hypothetical protein
MASPTEERARADHTEELKDRISATTDQAGRQALGIIQSAKQEARSLAEQQKRTGAQQISVIARAVEGAADHLEGDMPQASKFVHDMASSLEAAASSLRARNADDLLREAGNFARRQPAMFFAGAVLTGLAFSRFLKSTSSNVQE